LVLAQTTPASAAGQTKYVVAADISTSRAAPGATGWFADPTPTSPPNGSFATTSTAFDGSESLQLSALSAAYGIRVLNSYGTGASTPTIPQIVAGASYTYSGTHVNFQIELFYTPKDSTYGPDTNPANPNRCTAAGAALPGQCYTVIKWEPLADSPAAWTKVDLSADNGLNVPPGAGGWKNTNRIGIYAKPGPQTGNSLTEYLAQMMTGYTVLAVGAAVGTGTDNAIGYLQTITYADVEYRFMTAPVVVTTSPATSESTTAAPTTAAPSTAVPTAIATTSSSEALAATGADMRWPIVAGVALLLTGAALTQYRRPRRH
jgi:LPXTG-motif cell wall-anchored protein